MRVSASGSSKNAWRYRAGLAGVMIAALVWWYTWDLPYTPALFFYQYYRPFPSDSLEAWALHDVRHQSVLDSSLHHYRGGDIAGALPFWESLRPQFPTDPLLHLYLAQGYIALKKKEAALAALDVVEKGGNEWEVHAHWYRALVYLQHNQRDSTLEELKHVIPYQPDPARALENDLVR